jgi:hypothetical protein
MPLPDLFHTESPCGQAETGSQQTRHCRLDETPAILKNYSSKQTIPSRRAEQSSNPELKERNMSTVRVLVGTKKGAFILTADAKRQNWEVSGPHFAGWEMYHLKGSPVDPDRIYASQTSGWFGQIIQRSDDGGTSRHA